MKIRRISIEKINPAPYNPRLDLKPGDPEYEKIRRSLDEFGCVEPLVWNQRTGNLVGGHQRFKILRARGDEFVRVSVVDLSLDREKALNIALNKIQGDWDEAKLASLLQELLDSSDVDIELTGFDLPDVEGLLAGAGAGDDQDPDDFDVEAAADRDKPAVTQVGDLIELGPHRLVCGDSSLSDVHALVLGDRTPNLLFSDPPYNVDYYGGSRPTPQKARPKQSRQWKRIYADDQSQGDYEGWLEGILTNAINRLRPGAAIYLWNGHRQFGPMHTMLTRMDVHISCVITWAKESFAIGYGDYNQQTEFCLYGWKPGKKGGHAWFGPTNASTLWQVRRDPTKSYSHPTQKPVALPEQAIRNSSKIGDVVLDCFLGSGTTLIACERLRRACCGIEIDPHHCDAIVRRYIAHVGEDNVAPALVERYRIAAEAVS
ncbi:MAG: DNA modification methylase [Phycisphaerales bacterium]|nr:DNA modification methylase [Phycisphaerales bacterium]MCB9855484.1 DNA modification methylase [Phycisphaerales bacterium]MCB9864261.1 DNA modification methylase [Phycisphaerales bacterium]